MRMTRYVLACLLVVGAAIALWVGVARRSEAHWFEVQHEQLAEIERIGSCPPRGWDELSWRNATVTVYNVWGNVTYSPDYSQISYEEMVELKKQLEAIAVQTNSENSMESVDRVFQLLLARGQRVEFISGYRQEFLAIRDQATRENIESGE